MTDFPKRPYTILLCTMGGQGGAGVEPMAAKGGRILCNWIVLAARAAGFAVQSTLTPGTGQRTGLNTLYIEIYPADAAALAGRKPVFRLAPRPGDIDLLVAYELVEAGRALTQGLVSKDRTTLIASTHRFYTQAEKGVTTDGRIDAAAILAAVKAGAKQSVLFDAAEACRNGGSVNAVMLGAIAALAPFPIAAEHLEQAIGRADDGINTPAENLAAFARGKAATDSPDGTLPNDESFKRRRGPLPSLRQRIVDKIPAPAQSIVQEAAARVAEFQNLAYANHFLDRLATIRRIDGGGPANDYSLTRETARHLALWLSYDDIIRVADLKTRPDRLARIRAEVDAGSREPLRITEFFKPGLDEWTAVLPTAVGRSLRQLATRFGLRDRLNLGLHIRSTAIWGYILLRVVARLRFLRPISLGRAEEEARIARWLDAIERAVERDYGLALEIAACARLIKGYGETRQRGYAKFERIFAKLVEPALAGWLHNDNAATAVSRSRAIAFANPEGAIFESQLTEIAAAANADLAAAETGTAVH